MKTENEEKNIISFGAGQNSTAMIILMKNQGSRIDEIIFAETGNEMPETYKFLKEFSESASGIVRVNGFYQITHTAQKSLVGSILGNCSHHHRC